MNENENSPFTNEIREVCYELLSKNVGLSHVSSIIKCVINKLTNFSIGKLPSKSQLALMQREIGSISKIQAASAVLNDSSATLHSDGTSKKGIILVACR